MALNTDLLAKLLAMAGSDKVGEAANAISLAQNLLAKEGLSFTDVAEMIRNPTPASSSPSSHRPSGFTAEEVRRAKAAMEEERAREQAARREAYERRRAPKLAELVARYGSEEGIKAPTEREQRLIDATRHLRPELENWERSRGDLPRSIIDAVSGAYPTPSTVTEAKAEKDHWDARNRDLCIVYGAEEIHCVLNPAAAARQALVEDLFFYGLRAQTLDELELRVNIIIMDGWYNLRLMATIRNDIRRLKECSTVSVHSGQRAADRRALVMAALQDPANQGRSDRSIAVEFNVSPQTVNNIRKRLGIGLTARTVTRRRFGRTQQYRVGA